MTAIRYKDRGRSDYMYRLIAICIVASGAFACSDDSKPQDAPCEGPGCYLLGCQWYVSDVHCDDGFNGLEYVSWTETSFGCDNPEHDGVTRPGRNDCQEWETCLEDELGAACEIE